MTLTEVQSDLFLAPQGYYLVHCISGDYALGAGIAKQFNSLYDMRFRLHRDFPIPEGGRYANVGRALLVGNVFNLVTKPLCYHKPRHDDLYDTLIDLREQCENLHINKLAMPKIGCGLDRLNWNDVRDIIEEVFEDTDIDILVCYL
jgi:hypothetical protein